jgi:hypothetical protein
VISSAHVGSPTAAATKVIGHGVRLKGTRIFYAHGTAVAPKSVTARFVPKPAQHVKVEWSLVCQKPNRSDPAYALSTSETSGQTSVVDDATVKLALPYPKPPTCVATVYATLAGKGDLVVQLQEA